jgi:zinc protease
VTTRRALVAMLAVTACAPLSKTVQRARPVPWDAPMPWGRSGVDWTKPPPLAEPAPFAAPRAQRFTLGNGIRVVVVENSRVPIVAIKAVHASAGSRSDGATPGVAALTLGSLDEGISFGAVRVELRIATDHASMETIAATTDVAHGLASLATMSRSPKLSDSTIERVRAERGRELAQRKERPRTVAAHVFDRVVFGSHPYGNPAEGVAAAVATITASDVRAFWARAYRPSALTLIVAGDVVAAEVRRHVETAFGAWREPGATAATTTATAGAPALPAYTPQLALVDVPGAAQSVVLIGTRGDAAGAPSQLAADVASSVVGGGVGARLDRELHERLALSLGASASAWRGRWAGSWALATTLSTDKTLAGIRAALAVVDDARGDITAGEVARARGNLIAAAQLSFETVAGTVRALERATAHGLPDDWYATYARRLAAIGVDDVRAAAAAWRDLSIVVVGDAATLEVPLRDLGLPLVRYSRDATVLP